MDQLQQLIDSFKTMDLTTLMGNYRKFETVQKELKGKLANVEALLDHIEVAMNDNLLATNQDGAITQFGSVKRVTKNTYYADDKIAFRDWVIQNDLTELMNTSLATRAFSSWLEEQTRELQDATGNPNAAVELPPGVGIKSEIKLSITKK